MQEEVPLIKLHDKTTKLVIANSKLFKRKQLPALAQISTLRRGLIRRSPSKSSHHPEHKHSSPISIKNKSIIMMVVIQAATLDDLRKGS